ncbi:hypothetical protein JG688_00000050 [Phytophthora aleatoria]|uniref:Uncharacterized protein n=1 Tax=Phytophthora aleatoria TaxID=2496075 RepID=A0A8J5JEH7_9STRA|nr:hypothetical protein JG688_00000050 [Phytophthora aleatoria]
MSRRLDSKERNPQINITHGRVKVREFTSKHKDAAFDWIVMFPGILPLNGRTKIPEGLDMKMAIGRIPIFMITQLPRSASAAMS